MPRKPLALSNWKMTMTISDGLAFVRELDGLIGETLGEVDAVICPAYTVLWPVSQAIKHNPLQLGAQNVSASAEPTHTGEVSAELLADAGCKWVMLSHWEVRRNLGDDDQVVNQKLRRAWEAGLQPILLVGESRSEHGRKDALLKRLNRMLAGCQAEQAAKMAFVYEPEASIGADEAAGMEQVAAGCGLIRDYLKDQWGATLSEQVRIIYGGSVSPENAKSLLGHRDVDGLGASRKGRDPQAFAEIVRQIHDLKST